MKFITINLFESSCFSLKTSAPIGALKCYFPTDQPTDRPKDRTLHFQKEKKSCKDENKNQMMKIRCAKAKTVFFLGQVQKYSYKITAK